MSFLQGSTQFSVFKTMKEKFKLVTIDGNVALTTLHPKHAQNAKAIFSFSHLADATMS